LQPNLSPGVLVHNVSEEVFSSILEHKGDRVLIVTEVIELIEIQVESSSVLRLHNLGHCVLQMLLLFRVLQVSLPPSQEIIKLCPHILAEHQTNLKRKSLSNTKSLI